MQFSEKSKPLIWIENGQNKNLKTTTRHSGFERESSIVIDGVSFARKTGG
jgi:hypothetical protein